MDGWKVDLFRNLGSGVRLVGVPVCSGDGLLFHPEV